MVVENDLLLQILRDLIPNPVCFIDTLGDGLVPGRELVQGLHLLLEVLALKDELMLGRVSEQFLSLRLRLSDNLFEPIQAEDFFERSHAL